MEAEIITLLTVVQKKHNLEDCGTKEGRDIMAHVQLEMVLG